jgi:hypothetical protein
MKNSKIEDKDFDAVANELGVSPADVKNVVNSFFDSIVYEARKLPFDNHRKIYSKSAFEKHAVVRSIPFIGRIGPTYTRYLKWRANESKDINMVPRPKSKTKLFPEEIEAIAQSVLAGNVYESQKTRKKNYKRVWLVFDSYKKQAGQVIPKEEDVYYQEG